MHDDIHEIKDLPLYRGLPDEAREALHLIARIHRLRAGSMLFMQGEITSDFYSILSGGVRLIENTEDGKQVNLKVYGPGDIFGLLAWAGKFTHKADVVAVDHTEVLVFSAAQARSLSHQYPEIALKIIDLLVIHVEHAHTRIRSLAAEKVERRLARSLLHFCEKFGKSTIDHPSANFSQQDIAEFTGTTVETVNRTFKKWEKQQLIQQSRMSVIVTNPAGLRKIAGDKQDAGMGYFVE